MANNCYGDNMAKPIEPLSSAGDGASSQVAVEESEQHLSVQNEQIAEIQTSKQVISERDQCMVPLERLSSGQAANIVQLNPTKVVGNGGGPAGLQHSNGNNIKALIKAQETIIKPSRKRYFILFMYIVLQFVKSFQWICLASVTNVAAKFYMVDNYAINWTAILFMVTFLILALPCSWFMELFGLRRSVLVGSFGVTLGLIIKCFSCHRNGFLVGMFGHLIVGITEPFYFSSYSQLASVWFPDDQVAKATSFAIIGEELGVALGFIIPPLMIGARDGDSDQATSSGNEFNVYGGGTNPDDQADMQAVQNGLWSMFFTLTIISSLNTVSLWLFFDEQPTRAPGIARFKQIEAIERSNSGCLGAGRSVAIKNFKTQMRQLNYVMRDKNFLKLFVGFGLNVGISYSIHTLLNQLIVRTWWPTNDDTTGVLGAKFDSPSSGSSDAKHDIFEQANVYTYDEMNLVVGNAGLILIIAGLLGSAGAGYILDRFHKHKLTAGSIYLLTLISMILLFAYLHLAANQAQGDQQAHLAPAWPLYLLAIPLGFSLTGYASCGYDYGVELTYPMAELLSSTLLNMSAQIFGIPISIIGSKVVDLYGDLALGSFFCAILLAGFLLTCLQGGQLNRQRAVQGDNQRQVAREREIIERISEHKPRRHNEAPQEGLVA